MTIVEVLEKYSGTIRGTHSFVGGEHYTFHFSNGWGLSVIKNDTSYGHEADLYETAVFHNGELLNDSVVGFQSPDDIATTLESLKQKV